MAQRSARSHRSRAALVDEDEAGFGAVVSRHRLLVGGATAFAVAFSYVAANALWYQPHAHGGAFFPTRPLLPAEQGVGASQAADEAAAAVETIIRLERSPETTAGTPAPQPRQNGDPGQPAAPAPLPPTAAVEKTADPVVKDVQRILAQLNLYDGTVDGLMGPQTRRAIESYRKMVGLSGAGDVDDQLLAQLGAIRDVVATPPPQRASVPGTDMMATSSAVLPTDLKVVRIQAGLKAFGNDGIELDGIVGSRTRSAIREFQSLFGLPETGEPDDAVYAKMREIGLTD